MVGLTPKIEGDRPLRVLCLGAHGDDIEIGCGASLLQWMADGQALDVCWVVFSGGQARAKEAKASATFWLEAASNQKIELHNFKDGFFPDEWGGIKRVFEQLKEACAPDLIFTHFREDRHQDHRIINELTWNTFRNHSILEYEIPKYDGDFNSPNFYIPLSKAIATAKTDALMKSFGSQRDKHWFSKELFGGLMRIRGMESCSPSGYAEGFYVRKACLAL